MPTATAGVDDVRVGARIRELRRHLQISQDELGGDRFSGSYISHLEKGRRAITTEVLEYFATQLGTTPGRLIGNEPIVTVTAPVAPSAPADQGVDRYTVHLAREAYARCEYELASRLAARVTETAPFEGESWWDMALVLSRSLFETGRYAEAQQVSTQMFTHPIALASPMLRAEAMVLSSRAARFGNDLGSAFTFASDARTLVAGTDSAVELESLLALIGAAKVIDAQAPVDQWVDRLAELSHQLPSRHDRGLACWILGNVRYAQDVAAGEALHDEAETLLNPQADLRTWGRFHKARAALRMTLERTEQVAEWLSVARVSFQMSGAPDDVIELHVDEAKLAILENRHAEALRLIDYALTDDALTQSDHTHGDALEVKVMALVGLGRDAEAAEVSSRMHALRQTARSR